MASKRLKKKREKQQAQKILAERQGLKSFYDAPKLTQAEAQKIIKNKAKSDQQKKRIQSYKNYAISKGVPASIITNKDVASKEKTEQFITDYLKKQKAEQKRLANDRRYADKVNRLINAGMTREEAEKFVGSPSKQVSYDKISSHLDNSVITCKNFLYVGFADRMGKGFYIEEQDAENSLYDIKQRVKEAKDDIDGSDYNFNIFVIDYGSEADMDEKAWAYYQRSMNFSMKHPKFDGQQYHKITISNKWSRRDFLNLINSCIQQMLNSDVVPFVQKAQDYCTTNKLNWLEKVDE